MTPEEEAELAGRVPWRQGGHSVGSHVDAPSEGAMRERQRVLEMNRVLLGERNDDAFAREAAG